MMRKTEEYKLCELLARNVKQLSGQIGNDRDKSAVIRTNSGTIRNARCTSASVCFDLQGDAGTCK